MAITVPADATSPSGSDGLPALIEAPPTSLLPARRVELLGARFDAVTRSEAVAQVLSAVRARRGRWVITANLDHLRRHHAESDVRDLLGQADSVVADGTPIVWASRLAGDRLPERVAGSDLVWGIAGGLADIGGTLYLLGADPGIAEKAAAVLEAEHPDLRIVGVHSPPRGFEASAQEQEEITQRLLEVRPDVVYVALGFPKQDVLIRQLRPLLPETTFIGVGISLSFIAGDVVRAPLVLQRLGLEWTHRMLQEPGRLAKRYLLEGLPFAGRLMVTSAWRRVRRGTAKAAVPQLEQE